MRLGPSWWVYIVQCRDGTYYTGITTNITHRISQHNRGLGAKYTRGRGPVTLKWCIIAGSKSDASKREAQIKKMSRSAKEVLMRLR